jgi:hypothetical protein
MVSGRPENRSPSPSFDRRIKLVNKGDRRFLNANRE